MTAPAQPTRQQTRILEAIRSHVTEHGYPPSVRELAAAVGLASTSSVAYELNKMQRAGLIRKADHTARAIVVVEP
ncbi:MAG: MarR family transcriptional regulator [Chloroflexi bacterium]|nr:MarR family transcriptional regulator [Chloroflexota bacterium]